MVTQFSATFRAALEERASIDMEKERLRAQLEREAAPIVPTVTTKPDGGFTVTHAPEKKGK